MSKEKYADYEQDGTIDADGKTYDKLVKKNKAGEVIAVAFREKGSSPKSEPKKVLKK